MRSNRFGRQIVNSHTGADSSGSFWTPHVNSVEYGCARCSQAHHNSLAQCSFIPFLRHDHSDSQVACWVCKYKYNFLVRSQRIPNAARLVNSAINFRLQLGVPAMHASTSVLPSRSLCLHCFSSKSCDVFGSDEFFVTAYACLRPIFA